MPLRKSDSPTADRSGSDADAAEATQQVTDAGAGVPDAMRDAAEALPEKDEVQVATKEGMLADDAQSESQAKLTASEASPNSQDTPSGYALKETAGISDNVERGEAYTRAKTAKRWGYVPVEGE